MKTLLVIFTLILAGCVGVILSPFFADDPVRAMAGIILYGLGIVVGSALMDLPKKEKNKKENKGAVVYRGSGAPLIPDVVSKEKADEIVNRLLGEDGKKK